MGDRPVLPRVVVVDDNVAYAQNIAEILEIRGCAAEVYATAEDALPVVLASVVRAVITDYRLPGMDGIELVRRIFSARGDVRAVVISAYADETAVTAARQLGAEFLSKPVDFGLLGQLVPGSS
jgi:DNA-binding NtrC family response regulator